MLDQLYFGIYGVFANLTHGKHCVQRKDEYTYEAYLILHPLWGLHVGLRIKH